MVLSWSAIDDFVNQQESANTKKKTKTDMNTLLRYMEANGMKNELEHLFFEFFLTLAGRTEKAASQQQFQVFYPVYSDT